MSVFLQIVLINLAVSCDNVGVIAMATRGLPDRQAAAMRRLGIGLAPAFTMAFIWAAGRLLDISWLHIRLLGGAAMMYVTWQMMKEGACCGGDCANAAGDRNRTAPAAGNSGQAVPAPASCSRSGRTRLAAVSILASDLTMAMENAIAVLSVLSGDGRVPDGRGFMAAALSLLICLPILLWCSGRVARMMEEVPAVSCLFAGYMAYTAVTMALQDESVVLFLSSVHFRHSLPAAAAAGILTAAAGYDMRREQASRAALCRTGSPLRPRGLPLLPYTAVVIYAATTVHVFAHLVRGPVINGIGVSPELLFGFSPSGAAAVRAAGAPPHLLSLFTCLLAVRAAASGAGRVRPFSAFRLVCRHVAAMVGLYVLLCGAGFFLLFGPGAAAPLDQFGRLGLQILLHWSYAALFFCLSIPFKNRAAATIFSLFWLMAEDILVDVFCYSGHLRILAGFLPEYYIHALSFCTLSPVLIARCALAAGILILIFAAPARRRERAIKEAARSSP
ncbi:MAG: hypothetical protein KH230_18060 [Enterocloster asparagiformis]|nr:hypothetical protein [Enterocloster asparagiformis]